MQDSDVIIVGTGPAGVHAAWPLAMRGKNITIIDGGREAPHILTSDTLGNFEDIRAHDIDQWKLFLGEDCTGIPLSGLLGGLGGGQTSGNRSYVVRDTPLHLPLETSAQILQSLAQGGLGAVWGAAGAFLSASELTSMGLPSDEIETHYDIIARRIGISGPSTRTSLQPALKLDQHGRAMLEKYQKKMEEFTKIGVSVLQPPSAVLTEDLGGRKKTTYADMDYWVDPGKSVYRPQYTLDELRKLPNVQYMGGFIVESIKEEKNSVCVQARSMQDASINTWTAKRIILAAGTVNSARILLASNQKKDVVLPFIGKPHVFIPCLRLSALGKAGDRERVSLCQLVAIEDRLREGLNASCAQLYSYRSMLLFRILSAIPLPVPLALHAVRILAPCLIIADLRFPGVRENGSLQLKGSRLHIAIDDTKDVKEHAQSIAVIRRALHNLGLFVSRTMPLPPGSTSHYGGSIPIGEPGEHAFTLDRECRLHGSSNIFVADASVFRILPAKPHTFTIMANANRVGTIVANL